VPPLLMTCLFCTDEFSFSDGEIIPCVTAGCLYGVCVECFASMPHADDGPLCSCGQHSYTNAIAALAAR
jgi:hypothetical protein